MRLLNGSVKLALGDGAMPRTISNQWPRPAGTANLVADLVQEILTPRESGQPMILERHMDVGESVHVTVVWDRFADVLESDRTAIILDAYERAMGKPYRERISLATGVTVPEAGELELLPFEILPAPRKTDADADIRSYHAALVAEGASVLRGDQRPELRFETLADAQAAVERLEQRLPRSRGLVVQGITNHALPI